MEQRATLHRFETGLAGPRVRVEVFSTVAEAGWTIRSLQWLGAAERAYGATFQQANDRERFLASRYRLRTALESFTGVAAGRWHFTRNDEGRWRVVTDASLPPVTFGVAHSGHAIAVVLGTGVDVGIDLEPTRTQPLNADAAWTPRERQMLQRLPEANRISTELRLWTAKEAYLKLLGRGAFLDFADVDLSSLFDGSEGTEFGGSAPTHFRFGTAPVAATRYEVAVAFRLTAHGNAELEFPTWLKSEPGSEPNVQDNLARNINGNKHV